MDPQSPQAPPDGSTAALLLNRNRQPASAGPPPSEADPTGPLSALRLLVISFAVSFVASTVGGAVHAHFMQRLLADRDFSSGVSAALGVVSAVFYLLHFGAAALSLVALERCARAPAAARVTGLCRAALGLFFVSLLLSLASFFGTRFVAQTMSAAQLSGLLMLTGYVDTAVHFAGTVMLIEILLRLRRWAASADATVVESEGFVRGGLIGILVARTLINNVSHFATPLLVGLLGYGHAAAQWLGYFMRLPLSIAFFSAMLWLLQTTAKALRTAPTAAPGLALGASASAAASVAGGYRNLMVGALIAGVGLALTIVSYANASSLGGRYVIAYGAIVAGIIQFLRGLAQVLKR